MRNDTLNETNEPRLVSDTDLAEIEARLQEVYAKWHSPGYVKRLLDTDIPALCQTVRAAWAKYERLKSKIAWHRDGVEPDVPVLQERYDRVIRERSEALDQCTALHQQLAQQQETLTAIEACKNPKCGHCMALLQTTRRG